MTSTIALVETSEQRAANFRREADEARALHSERLARLPTVRFSDGIEAVQAWLKAYQFAMGPKLKVWTMLYHGNHCADPVPAILDLFNAGGTGAAFFRDAGSQFTPETVVLSDAAISFGDISVPLTHLSHDARYGSAFTSSSEEEGYIYVNIVAEGPREACRQAAVELNRQVRALEEAGTTHLRVRLGNNVRTLPISAVHANERAIVLGNDVILSYRVFGDQTSREHFNPCQSSLTTGETLAIFPVEEIQGDSGDLRSLLGTGSLYFDARQHNCDWLSATTLVGVRRIVHVVDDLTSLQTWEPGTPCPPRESKTLFSWDLPPEGITLDKVFRALWASYLLSLEATEAAGTNDRAHVGRPALPVAARAVLADLKLETTPWSCVYGSDAAYWDCTDVCFDPKTQTLTCEMFIGS